MVESGNDGDLTQYQLMCSSQMFALHDDLSVCTVMQEVDTIVGNISKLGDILGVEPQVTQTLVTKDPR